MSAAGAKPVLVLVPGLLCDAAVWRAQQAALGDSADILIAENGLLDSLPAMAAKILAEAPPRFAIAGHSMGGRVALEVQRSAPERVLGLALLDSGAQALAAGEAGARERARRMQFVALAEQQGLRAMSAEWLKDMVHPARRSDAELTAAIIDMQARRTPAHLLAQTRALLARPDAEMVLRAAQVPVLLLTGTHDLNSPPAANRQMASLNRRGLLAVLPDSGHMAPMEQPLLVNSALQAWLSRLVLP